MLDKSYHQLQVEAFMLRQNNPLQTVPVVPTKPSPQARILRAKLIIEEALETIEGLGVDLFLVSYDQPLRQDGAVSLTRAKLDFEANERFDLIEAVDGCCDLRVVTTGTLSAMGIPDAAVQCEVDNNNLQKFGPGHKIREDGKLIKPMGHKPPRIHHILSYMFPEVDL
jgi:predicted HAD superfamily Cof-like phosphohydrolase